MAELAAMLHVDHQFHIANYRWTHDAIETCNRQVLNLLRSLCSELGSARQQWPTLIPLVRYALNNAISPVSGYAPVTLHMGSSPSSPLDSIWSPVLKSFVQIPLSQEQVDSYVSERRSSFESMHSDVVNERQRSHLRANKGRKAPEARFRTGDFVLAVSKQRETNGNVERSSKNPGVSITLHFYHRPRFVENQRSFPKTTPTNLKVTTELLQHIGAESAVYEVEDIIDAKQERRRWNLLVQWRGFSPLDNSWGGRSVP
uniref:Chromo domain-containing protein n=1 Tax=Spongospora subterranea TaxID=70186 RepID=A0A0H5R9F7_9EUKA|eukprot:CRZ10760.1 hypothetical protein [Spongospora subterranea]